MSCGGDCPGGGESPRIPSFIPSNRPQRQRVARPRRQFQRVPTQTEATGIGPAAPYWRPGPIGSPPTSPRSPLAVSSPVHQLSPDRYAGVVGPARRPVVASPQRQVAAVAPNLGAPIQQLGFNRGALLPRFATPPRRGPCPVGVAAPSVRARPPPALDQTYRVPGRMPPVPLPSQRRPPMNVTYDRGPPVLDRTYVRAPPVLDQTYDIPGRYPPVPIPRPRFGDTFTISHDESGVLADSIMDDMGDDIEWDISTAVSIDDLVDNSGEEDAEEDEEPSFGNVAEGTRIDEDDGNPPCVPCGGEDLSQYFPNINQPRLDNVTPNLYDSGEYLDNASPPPYLSIGDNTPEDSSLGLLPNEGSLSASLVHQIAEASSNISVFDAEELNRTTAPRNVDIDIPRTRIWQTLMNTLNETENAEDLEYEQFLAGIQQERRDWMESSRIFA